MSGRQKALKWLGYVSFFLVCFVAGLYLTFPVDLLRPRVSDELNRVLNARKNPGAYGKPGSVTFGSLSLWRLSGVELKNVVVVDVTTNPDPAPPWELDVVRLRVGLLGLLRKQLAVTFDIQAYDGSASGDVLVAGEKFQQIRAIDATASGIAWWKMAAIQQAMKVPGAGTVGGEVHMTAGKDIKEAAGDIRIRGEGLTVGPGELAIPLFGKLTIPAVDMGALEGDIKVADGKTSGPPITLTGRDVQAAVDAPLLLRMPMEASQIQNGALALKLAEPFLKDNPRFKTVFDLTPQFKEAKDTDGAYKYRLRGTVGRPDAKPDRTAKIQTKS